MKRFLATILAVFLALAMLVGVVPAAQADSTLTVRLGPAQWFVEPALSAGGKNLPVMGTVGTGTRITVRCWVRGQKIYSNDYKLTSDLWYRASNGWYVNGADFTSNQTSAPSGIAECGATVPGLSTQKWYTIRANHSGKVLDVAGGSTTSGTKIRQWTANGSAAQQFRFIKLGATSHRGAFYRVESKVAGTNQWDLSGNEINQNGVKLQIWGAQGWSSRDSQYLVYSPTGSLRDVQFRPRHNTNKCLDIQGGNTSTWDGAAALIWDCGAGAKSRSFTLTAVADVYTDPGYRLPFTKGAQYKITQSPQDSFSHNDAYNKTAVDFAMNTGTPIRASASGRVYFEGWVTSGAGIQILVDHGDNKCAQYAHLSRTIIDRGQYVSRGQIIGYSGATGNVTGPHLHWAMVNCNTQTSREIINTLEHGRIYPKGTYSKPSQNG
ncbi:hypothetical protein AUR04nite_17480 [Glutamicibacter uratoxydans]|uniref:Ricin B lectin domain-containing protein n=1 Tax=Glutamicibacter uratoxydans TaxID=43667 RepID=A0A4Y4DMP6_GLUUR|nr:peptidoglycan DD-metalloendopeptidase family protein [Glutamicibacter uratoxydans]GED06216.1 hypothetical protein AUR04nite_17480 [Glutamicibacter uratoxydans]